MNNLETFRSELKALVDEAEKKDGSGPDIHADMLEVLLLDIRESWDDPKEALEEVTYVLNKVFPEAKQKSLKF